MKRAVIQRAIHDFILISIYSFFIIRYKVFFLLRVSAVHNIYKNKTAHLPFPEDGFLSYSELFQVSSFFTVIKRGIVPIFRVKISGFYKKACYLSTQR